MSRNEKNKARDSGTKTSTKKGATSKLPVIPASGDLEKASVKTASSPKDEIKLPSISITPSSKESVTATAATAVQSDPAAAAAASVSCLGSIDQGLPDTEDSTSIRAEQSRTADPVIQPSPPANGDGNVILIYEQYNEEFPIVGGSTTHAAIDEVYCLSFVMEGCVIHLSKYNPAEKRDIEIQGLDALDTLFMPEEPLGVYKGLEAGKTYFVYVEQAAEQLKREEEQRARHRERQEQERGKQNNGNAIEITGPDDGRGLKSCECIYGKPCLDEYGCLDWKNRFTIAKANGWAGFEEPS